MPKNLFLDNADYGKNSWWRYILTSFASWLGPIILILIILIPYFILFYPSKIGSAEEVFNNFNPIILLLFFGVYYALSFLLFYIFTRIIHHKKLIIFINTLSKVRWLKILKGAGLWFALMGIALLIQVIIYPSSVKLSFNPTFFTLLVLSIIIYSIQASFEEIFFRGYLMQGIGLITRKPVIPLLITSALFALGHFFNGSDNLNGLGMVINMFIFGMTMAIITLGENSLETAMGVHIANNIFLTTIINGTGIFNNLPSLLTIEAGSAMIIPSFILLPILLFIVFRGKWDKIQLISKRRFKLSEINGSNNLSCVKCETENPSIAVFCTECGEKIKVTYASTIRKTIAFTIDIVVLLFLFGILLIPIISLEMIKQSVNVELLVLIWITLDLIIFFLYFVVLEKNGQTLGKILMKIRVVRELDHKSLKYRQSFIRNLFLIVDLIPYPIPGVLAILFSAKSPKKQRIGDMVAGTLVIKKKTKY
jgi:uncharacterized protein